MTEKEMIYDYIERNNLTIFYKNENTLEFENVNGYDSILIEFSKDGKIESIGS